MRCFTLEDCFSSTYPTWSGVEIDEGHHELGPAQEAPRIDHAQHQVVVHEEGVGLRNGSFQKSIELISENFSISDHELEFLLH